MAKKYKSRIADNIQVKTGSTPAWGVISRATKLKYTDKDKISTVTFVNGVEEASKGGEQKMIRVMLSDSDLATLTALNALSGEAKPWYFDMGKVNGNYQELYIPEGTAFKDTEWESPASNDVLGNAIVIYPVQQTAVVSVTPSTGLPTEAKSHANASPVTSDNNFWVWIETAIS